MAGRRGGALVGILITHPRMYDQLPRAGVLYVPVNAAGRFDLPVPSELGTATVVAYRRGSPLASSAPITSASASRQLEITLSPGAFNRSASLVIERWNGAPLDLQVPKAGSAR